MIELKTTPEIASAVSSVESSTSAVREDFGKWVQPDASLKRKGCVDLFGISLLCQSPAETVKAKPSVLPSNQPSGSVPLPSAKPDCAFDLFGVELLCAETPSPTPTASVTPSLSPDASASPEPFASPTPSVEPNCALDLFGFELFCQPDASPTPVPTAEPDAEFVDEGQGCGLLPGSTPCATGLSCQLDSGLNAICKPIKPTPTPSEEPPVDLTGIQIVKVEPWEWNDVPELEAPTPQPSPIIAIVAPEPACTPENKEPVESACCAGLKALPEDPGFAGSRLTCQQSENAEIYTASLETLSFADPTPEPEEIETSALPVDELAKAAGGKGFSIPPGGALRDAKGNLYVVYQQPVARKITDEPYSYRATQFYMTTHIAFSEDGGETWEKLDLPDMTPQTGGITQAPQYKTITQPPGPPTTRVVYDPVNVVSREYDCPLKTSCCWIRNSEETWFESECGPKIQEWGAAGTEYFTSDLCMTTMKRVGREPATCYEYKALSETKQVQDRSLCAKTFCKDADCKKGKTCNSFSYSGLTPEEKQAYNAVGGSPSICIDMSCNCNPPMKAIEVGVTKERIEEIKPVPTPYPPFSKTYLAYYNTDGKFHQNEFQGMTAAPDGGVYLYFAAKQLEFSYTPRAREALTRQSTLHRVHVDGAKSPTGDTPETPAKDDVLGTDSLPTQDFSDDNTVATADGSLRYLGQSGSRQFYSKDQKLYYSDDYGKTRVQTGQSGYLVRKWSYQYFYDRCENGAYLPAKTVETTEDSIYEPPVKQNGAKLVHVAGNRAAWLGLATYPLLQQSDGYFINPKYLEDRMRATSGSAGFTAPYSEMQFAGQSANFPGNPKLAFYDAYLARYLQDPVFNRAFYERYAKFGEARSV
ncbi:MAG: hypothetical protein Q8P02_02450, partial [Candidatus Micrarchaeota archaeon]|nr:hypothetical protein [Candidatus Micrarchaeota archaeon]